MQYYRHAKTVIWTQEKQKKSADIARQRHEARLARLERIKQERQARLARRKRAVTGEGEDPRKAAIQAALERVKRKKAEADYAPANVDNLTDEQRKQIEAVDRRRQAASHAQGEDKD